MRRPWPPTEDAELVALFRAGLSLAEIGHRIGRSSNAVQTRVSELRRQGHDLPRRPTGVSRAQIEAMRKLHSEFERPRLGLFKTGIKPFRNPCVWWTPDTHTGAPA